MKNIEKLKQYAYEQRNKDKILIEELEKHLIKKIGKYKWYDSTKFAIDGSMLGEVTTDGTLYYKFGLTGGEFYTKYANTPDWETLPLLGPKMETGIIIK